MCIHVYTCVYAYIINIRAYVQICLHMYVYCVCVYVHLHLVFVYLCVCIRREGCGEETGVEEGWDSSKMISGFLSSPRGL